MRLPAGRDAERSTAVVADGLVVRVLGEHRRARLIVSGAEAEPELFVRVDGHLVPTGQPPDAYTAAVASPAAAALEIAIDEQGRGVVLPRSGVLVIRAVAPAHASSTVVLRDPNDVREELTLALLPIIERTVRVVDADGGEPVTADIALYDRLDAGDVDEPRFARSVALHGERVRLPYLAGAGHCELVVTAPGYVSRTLVGVTDEAGAEEELVVELEPDVAVYGTVLDARGAPIAGAEVTATHRSGFRRRYPGVSDARGRYRIGVPAGRVDLSVDEAGHVEVVREDVAVEDMPQDFVLVPARTVSVSGIVIDDAARPLPRADVELWFDGRPGRLGMRDELRQSRPARVTRTDEAGRFTFEPVRLGRYDLDVVPDAGALEVGVARIVPVRHRLRDGVELQSLPGSLELQLPATGHLLVTVAEDVRHACLAECEPAQLPYMLLDRVEDAERLASVARAPCAKPLPICFAYVPVAGSFVVRTIPKRRFAATAVEVNAVRSLVLGSADERRVTGIVFRDGHPVPNLRINATPPDGEGEVSSGRTDGSGRFELANPAAGPVLLHARAADASEAVWVRWIPAPHGLVLDWPAAVVAVEARSEAIREVVLELRELDGVDVTKLPTDGRSIWRASVGAERTAELRAIPAGLYRVHSRGEEGELRQSLDIRVGGSGRTEITLDG